MMMTVGGYYAVELFTVRSFESNRFTRKWVNIDFFPNWQQFSGYSRAYPSHEEKTIGGKKENDEEEKTESFHRDRIVCYAH